MWSEPRKDVVGIPIGLRAAINPDENTHISRDLSILLCHSAYWEAIFLLHRVQVSKHSLDTSHPERKQTYARRITQGLSWKAIEEGRCMVKKKYKLK